MRAGAWPHASGTTFTVFSANATAMELCIFAPTETRIPMQRQGVWWHADVKGAGVGTQYGFRAHGPWDPEAGHWFNPQKLLVDPYARAITDRFRWSEATQPSDRDSGPHVPKSVVCAVPETRWTPPRTPWRDTVIYEAHVKGTTQQNPMVRQRLRGQFLGLSSRRMIRHLRTLGVTAVQIMPVQAFLDDRFTTERGLSNYWGYQTLGFFAPDPRYGTPDDFREMVRRFHAAGIEVILDVVYNHTAEADETGPIIAFRGLDNASYYRMDGGRYLNDAGTGNTLDLTHPAVIRMVMDSLRHWVTEMGVDGFRFDLATVLGREAGGFDPGAGFFDALLQDPILSQVKLIAEPWDIGHGGYRLGEFPAPFAEWNDKYRDDLRRIWRGDAGMMPALARRLLGSAELFDRDHRGAWSSVNFLTAHDGFTLADLVSYSTRHNDANGEGGRDGHAQNHSDNMGTEGPDPALDGARAQRMRNMLASLFLSQGTPMILSGDEVGNTQDGNNNAYAQDNPIGWVRWQDDPMTDFIARLAALRRALPVLRQGHFLHGQAVGDHPDVIWRTADGRIPAPGEWDRLSALGVELRAADTPAVFMFFNPDAAIPLTLPDTCDWQLALDTARADADPPTFALEAPAHSVLLFRQIV